MKAPPLNPPPHPAATAPAEVVSANSTSGLAPAPRPDLLAVEEPLEIRVAFSSPQGRITRSLAVTMRTPGHDFDLAAGFLFSERVVDSAAQILAIRHAGRPRGPHALRNIVRIDLAPNVSIDFARLQRNFYASSSCGVCGKSSIDSLASLGCSPLPTPGPTVPASLLYSLPDSLRTAQSVFECTGGLHAAAIFHRSGSLALLREDIGRHNAVDKIIGHALRSASLPLADSLLLVSGRAGFELVQKSIAAGIPILAAVGAPSSLAVDLAREFDLTLIGFLRQGRFNIYSRPDRISP